MNAQLSDQDHKKVIGILAEQLGVAREQLTGPARIVEDLGADSLTRLEIAMALEENFHTTIADEQLETVRTVDDLCEALAEALAPMVQRH